MQSKHNELQKREKQLNAPLPKVLNASGGGRAHWVPAERAQIVCSRDFVVDTLVDTL